MAGSSRGPSAATTPRAGQELKGEGSPILPARTPRHQKRQEGSGGDHQGPEQLIALLQAHADGPVHWDQVSRILHLIAFMAQCKPSLVQQLAKAEAPKALIAVMKGVMEGEGVTSTAQDAVLGDASQLLLSLVESEEAECRADVLAADSIAMLLSILVSPTAGPRAKQNTARILRHFVTAGPVWRGPLLANGGLVDLPRALRDPLAVCDLLFTQEVLWALVGLVDAAVTGGGEVPHPDKILATLVPLLQLLQVPQLSHLNHISALIIRVLHVLASGDDYSKIYMGQAGVVGLLIDAIRNERQAQLAATSEDGTGWAAGSSFSRTRTLEPNPERLAQSGLSPLVRRPSMDGPHGHGHSGSGGGQGVGSFSVQRSHSHGRMAISAAAAAPLGAAVSAWDRLMVALLVREILAPVDAKQAKLREQMEAKGTKGPVVSSLISCSGLAVLGTLLPVLVDGQTIPLHRLCIVKESVVAVKVLVEDNEPNQRRVVEAGGVPILLHLVATGDVTLAWQAADAVGNLATERLAPELVAQGAIEEIVGLLQESADALHLNTVRNQLEKHHVTGTLPSLPTPHAAYAHRGRKRASGSTQPRIQLVGRQQLSFAVSGCMYTTHSTYSMCDYCVPSASMRALLRILGSCVKAPALQNSANSNSNNSISNAQFASGSGGGSADTGRVAASRFVSCGGLYAIFLLLHHELTGAHHSKVASSILCLLNMALDTGLDVQDDVRKVGGLSLLTSLMESLSRPKGVTDIYQLRVQVCVVLQRLLEGNSANKLLARERGLIASLTTLINSSLDPESNSVLDDKEQVVVSALDLISVCIADSLGGQDSLVSAGGLRMLNDMLTAATKPPSATGTGRTPPGPPKLKGSPEVLTAVVKTMGLLVPGCVPAQQALLGSNILSVLVQYGEQSPASPLAQGVVYLDCQLLHCHANGKAHVTAAGLLGLMLKMLHTTPPSTHTACACQGLYALCIGDVDMQNEVVAQGGLTDIESLVRTGGQWRVHVMWLLCCLMYGNSYVKNAARQTPGLVGSLMRVMRENAIGGQQDVAIAAAHGLAQMCQSNHANQELVADEGGLEAVSEILQAVLGQSNRADMSPSLHRKGLPPLPNLPVAATAANGAAASIAPVPPTTATPAPNSDLGGLVLAAQYPGVLDAGLRLLAAMLEFNNTNQTLARESGCLGLVADLLLRAAEVRDLSALQRAFLLPAVAAACACVARAAQDCEENQQRLVSGHEDLAPALFRLLSVDEPYAALEAARALEYLVIRSDLVHDQDEDRAEFESDSVRTLVTALHSRGHAAAAARPGAGAPGSAAAGPSFWVTADASAGAADAAHTYGGMPVLGHVTSVSVREAAAVLVAVVKATGPAGTDTNTNPSSVLSPRSTSGTLPTDNTTTAAPAAGTTRAPSALARLFKWRGAGPGAASGDAAGAAAAGGGIVTGTTPDPANSGVALKATQSVSGADKEGGGEDSPRGGSDREDEADSILGTAGGSTGPASPNGGSGFIAPTSPVRSRPLPGLPKLQALGGLQLDHANGLATLQALQEPTTTRMGSDDWVKLVGKSAAAFQPVTRLVSEGPWRDVKVHLSWLLFLLAVRTPANRDLIAKLERSVVTPIASQLANAEAFYASAEAAEAVAAAAAQSSPALPVSTTPGDEGNTNTSTWQPPAPVPSLPPSTSHTTGNMATSSYALPRIPASGPGSASGSSRSSTDVPALPGAQPPGPPHAAASAFDAGVGVGGHAMGPASTLSDDDDLEYIKREVEMLAGVGGPRASNQ